MKNIKFFFILLFLTSCGTESEVKEVKEVKKTPFFPCPDKTIEQVFKRKFKDHNWSSFSKDNKYFVKYEGVTNPLKFPDFAEKKIMFLFTKNLKKNDPNEFDWYPTQFIVEGLDLLEVLIRSRRFSVDLCK